MRQLLCRSRTSYGQTKLFALAKNSSHRFCVSLTSVSPSYSVSVCAANISPAEIDGADDLDHLVGRGERTMRLAAEALVLIASDDVGIAAVLEPVDHAGVGRDRAAAAKLRVKRAGQ